MRADVTEYVWDHSTLRGTELLLMLAIAWYANKDGVAFPSIPTLGRRIKMDTRSVQRLLPRLVRSGELSIRRNAGRGGTHLFQIRMNGSLALFPVDKSTGSVDKPPGKLPPGKLSPVTNAAKRGGNLPPEAFKNLERKPPRRAAARRWWISPQATLDFANELKLSSIGLTWNELKEKVRGELERRRLAA